MPFDDPACFRIDRRGAGGGVLRPDAGAGQAAPRRGRPACAEGRPSVLAMVRSGLARRRRTTPMSVRPTDPRRAPCRSYGLGRACHPATDARLFLTTLLRATIRGSGSGSGS
jgi:hypothetical protein